MDSAAARRAAGNRPHNIARMGEEKGRAYCQIDDDDNSCLWERKKNSGEDFT